MEKLQQLIEKFSGVFAQEPIVQAIVVFLSFFIVAYILNRFFANWCKNLLIKFHTRIDENSFEAIKQPLFYTIILFGAASSAAILRLPENVASTINSLLSTIAIFVWLKFSLVMSKTILRSLSSNPSKANVIHPKTLPLFENIAFVFLVGIATYYLFINWHIDMTAWLASAGIVGIAVGFAAKDTLANLFSGVFIMADSPYKIGDFVVLDSGERGEVTRIGIRSTRILTRDDVEITVPNSVMGNTKIINESGGRHEKYRIRVPVGVAYGSDIDKVREVLMQVAINEPLTCRDPEPRVRFRQFGNSSLDFELLCWIEQPVLRGAIVDSLNCAVYKAFIEHAIEIPYPKHDVYIKQMPLEPKE
jgi:small-conductance mechanosensitive channel